MTFFIVSLIAGALTVLAPCILPLLPVVLGGSAADVTNTRRPIRIVLWLSLSVFVFTFLLKVSTVLIGIPEEVWTYFAAIVIGIFGITLVFPSVWEYISKPLARIQSSSNQLLGKGYQAKNAWGDILMAISLGPIFTTCSPTYFVILATVLPESFAKGVVYIIGYIIGLAIALLAIAYAGQKLLVKLNIAADPHGWFKRGLGILFIMLAVFIATGYEKKLETTILERGYFDVTKVEQAVTEKLLHEDTQVGEGGESASTTQDIPSSLVATQKDDDSTATRSTGERKPLGPRYTEIVRPDGFVNSLPFELKDYIGKKVILVDFLAYSCINCQRTFPYLNAWYKAYEDDGLLIVGIHTPEFAFERKKENVEEAAQRFGLTFPIVLDNSYATWTAYGNRYWPHKYLINVYGEMVYDHIGEGAYDETEQKIVELLNELKRVNGAPGGVDDKKTAIPETIVSARSPETYFGAARNSAYVGNILGGTETEGVYTIPSTRVQNRFYLGGSWKITDEYIESQGTGSTLVYDFDARNVYVVAESSEGAHMSVSIDGVPVVAEDAGDDVVDGSLSVSGSRLFHIFTAPEGERHTVELSVTQGVVRLYTFTFG